MIESYRTIKELSTGQYKEKGSKFIAYAHPVSSIAEAKTLNKHYRSKFYDARHHCFAYLISPLAPVTRAADDGEPSNSAGAPILGQIRSRELMNVMVLVVRYFGGTKLGVSGLIHAYKSAASEALDQAMIVEKEVLSRLKIQFEYLVMDQVMKLVKKYDVIILEQEMELNCVFLLEFGVKNEKYLKEELQNVDCIVI